VPKHSAGGSVIVMFPPINSGSEQRMNPLQVLQRLSHLLRVDITSQLSSQGELAGIAMHVQVDDAFERTEWTKLLPCGVNIRDLPDGHRMQPWSLVGVLRLMR